MVNGDSGVDGGRPVPPVARASLDCGSAAFAELSADLLQAGKAVRFQARGVSMRPLVRDGDVLLVRPMGSKRARLGDVVLCSTEPGRVLVHRVVRARAGRQGRLLTVQGDGVAQPDGQVAGARVYGRLVAVERNGVVIDMQRPAVRMLGYLAVLRSRWNVRSGGPFRLVRRLVKGLPVFSRYLA